MPGLASLLSRRTTNPRAGGAAAKRMHYGRKLKEAVRQPGYVYEPPISTVGGRGTIGTGPPGGEYGGVVGYRNGGRTMNPRAAAAAARRRNRPRPIREGFSPSGRLLEEPRPWPVQTPPGGWQEGGPVGVAPEEVEMASEIYARATPEQQDQITGGGGAPAMDEEAAIGEALAMAMGGGGGGGGPPMGGGGPPMGGMI